MWTRTAPGLMIFSIAVDSLDLLMHHPPWHVADLNELLPDHCQRWAAWYWWRFGVSILLASGFRFLAYGLKWYRRNPRRVWYHTRWLAFSFTMLRAAFGIARLVVVCVFRQ